jgi:LTXXQ motif family protein
MWSAVLVGAVAVMISGSSSVFAQQREGDGERGPKLGFSNEDRTQAIDARIASRLASVKERLRLTPEQAKNWPAYDAAFQAVAKLHRERMEAGQERPSDPVQRMRQRAEALGVMGAALSRLADAQGPLYNSLDEDQKRQFATLSQMLGDQSDMYPRSLRNDDRRSWRGQNDDDRRGWRGQDDDDRRSWRGREDGDRRNWRGRDDDDRRSWRGRDDDDRRGWRGRDVAHRPR